MQETKRGSEWEKNSVSLRTVFCGGEEVPSAAREDTGGRYIAVGMAWSREERIEIRVEQ